MDVISIYLLFIEWFLVGDKKECSGSYMDMGYISTIGECAEICKEHASMFAFGTSDYGVPRCSSAGCKCVCETATANGGACYEVTHNGYRLFKYETTSNM